MEASAPFIYGFSIGIAAECLRRPPFLHPCRKAKTKASGGGGRGRGVVLYCSRSPSSEVEGGVLSSLRNPCTSLWWTFSASDLDRDGSSRPPQPVRQTVFFSVKLIWNWFNIFIAQMKQQVNANEGTLMSSEYEYLLLYICKKLCTSTQLKIKEVYWTTVAKGLRK
jgi:hypothetical protein